MVSMRSAQDNLFHCRFRLASVQQPSCVFVDLPVAPDMSVFVLPFVVAFAAADGARTKSVVMASVSQMVLWIHGCDRSNFGVGWLDVWSWRWYVGFLVLDLFVVHGRFRNLEAVVAASGRCWQSPMWSV